MYYPYSYEIRDNTPKYYIANQGAVKGLKRLTSIQLQIHCISNKTVIKTLPDNIYECCIHLLIPSTCLLISSCT